MFNAHYLSLFDTAITEYFMWRGIDPLEGITATGFDFHTVKNVIEYYSPIHYEDEIEVHVRLGKLGRSSLHWDLAIFPQDEETRLTAGEVIWVYVDLVSVKAARIPEELVSQLKV